MFAVVWGLLAVSAPAQDLVAQALRYQDLPASIGRRFDAKTFDARMQALERETERRRA
jgi:hypothetical protein